MDITVIASLIKETAACLVVQKSVEYWLPRSLISYMKKARKELPTNVVMSLPKWLARKKGLDYA